MIIINNKCISPEFFSDNTQKLNICVPTFPNNYFVITWKYEQESELVTLQFICQFLRDLYPSCKLRLKMWYVPNGRMDRTESKFEVFTLKYFASIINDLNFERVEVLDTHSKVTDALIDRIVQVPVEFVITEVLSRIASDNLIIVFPDKGAYYKYSKLGIFEEYSCVFFEKTRDWETGELMDQQITSNSDLNGKDVLIVDDILSSGGTLLKTIENLKELKVNNIYVYVSHLLDKDFKDKVIGSETFNKIVHNTKEIFTTPSLVHPFSSYFTVI